MKKELPPHTNADHDSRLRAKPTLAKQRHKTPGIDRKDRDVLDEWQVHAVLEASPDGCLLTNADGKINFANRCAEIMFGYTRGELLALDINALLPLRVRADHQRYFDEFARNPQPRSLDTRGNIGSIRKDGSEFPIEISLSPVWIDGERMVIAVIRDVSELHSTYETMRIAREFFESTFVTAPVGMAITDLDGRYTKVNPALCKFIGYSEQELLTMTFLDITHPEDHASNIQSREDLLTMGLPSYEMVKRYIHKNGQEIWVLVVVSAVADKNGKPLYTIAQILDIDRFKRTEQALIKSRLQLRSLSVHQEGIVEDQRKRIAREVHDELGQSLTALKMDISLLRLRFGQDPLLLERLDGMRLLAEETIRVVRHVASNLRPVALDLGLTAAIEWLADDFSQRWNVLCNIDFSGDEIALGDMVATSVFRVVQESLANIARHAQASKVTISLQYGKSVVLRVADNGSGFDPTIVRNSPGLGLFGMRERVQAIGGTLKIYSEPGSGTTLTIKLPLPKRAGHDS